jgi:methylthioribose-1-phosphate isomerase
MAESPLTWSDDALVVIDQRALPQQVRRLRITTVDGLVEAIRTLAIEIGGVRAAPPGTAVFNPAFDVTPAHLVTAVVTENVPLR